MEKHKANTTARQQQQQQEEQQLAQQRQQEQELQRQLEQQLEQQQQQEQELQQRMILEHLQKGSSSSSPIPGDMSPIGDGIPVISKVINGNDEHNQQQPRYGSFTVEGTEITEEGAPVEVTETGGGPKVSSSYIWFQKLLISVMTHPSDTIVVLLLRSHCLFVFPLIAYR